MKHSEETRRKISEGLLKYHAEKKKTIPYLLAKEVEETLSKEMLEKVKVVRKQLSHIGRSLLDVVLYNDIHTSDGRLWKVMNNLDLAFHGLAELTMDINDFRPTFSGLRKISLAKATKIMEARNKFYKYEKRIGGKGDHVSCSTSFQLWVFDFLQDISEIYKDLFDMLSKENEEKFLSVVKKDLGCNIKECQECIYVDVCPLYDPIFEIMQDRKEKTA